MKERDIPCLGDDKKLILPSEAASHPKNPVRRRAAFPNRSFERCRDRWRPRRPPKAILPDWPGPPSLRLRRLGLGPTRERARRRRRPCSETTSTTRGRSGRRGDSSALERRSRKRDRSRISCPLSLRVPPRGPEYGNRAMIELIGNFCAAACSNSPFSIVTGTHEESFLLGRSDAG